MILTSAFQKVGVPIFATSQDINDLLALREIQADLRQQPIDIRRALMPDSMRDHFLDPNKRTETHVSKNALLTAFALLGTGSLLGRKIDCGASGVDEQGQYLKDGNQVLGTVNPQLFEEYASNPLEGAKAFFQSLHEKIGSPTRFMAMGFITPNPGMN